MNIRDAISTSLSYRSDSFNKFTYSEVEEFISSSFSFSSESEELRMSNFLLSVKLARNSLEKNKLDRCLRFILLGRHLTNKFTEVADLELIALTCFMEKHDHKMSLAKLKILNTDKEKMTKEQRVELTILRERIFKGNNST